MSENMSSLMSKAAEKEQKQSSKEKGESNSIWVQTVDGDKVSVGRQVAKFSPELCHQMQSGFGTQNNPICAPPGVEGPALFLIFEYCRFQQACLSDKGRKLIDDTFLKMDSEKLCWLVNVSRYLQLENLSHILSQAIVQNTNEHAEPQTNLEDGDNSSIGASQRRRLKKLAQKKKKKLEEQENMKKVEVPKLEDTCSVDDIVAFINGDSKKGRSKKNKNQRKKEGGNVAPSGCPSSTAKSSSLTWNCSVPQEDEFEDGDYDPDWKEKTDREVEDFARKLNVPLCQIRPDLNLVSRVEELVPHSPDENSLTDRSMIEAQLIKNKGGEASN